MKEINNIKTNLPLNEWLYEESDNGNILVILRSGKKHNYYTYKVNLNKELKVPEITKNNHFDIMEIWDITDLSDTKLLWQRGEILSEEEFMKEYHKVFDNDGSMRTVGQRYTTNEYQAENFIDKYEEEIKKYLFGLEVE